MISSQIVSQFSKKTVFPIPNMMCFQLQFSVIFILYLSQMISQRNRHSMTNYFSNVPDFLRSISTAFNFLHCMSHSGAGATMGESSGMAPGLVPSFGLFLPKHGFGEITFGGTSAEIAWADGTLWKTRSLRLKLKGPVEINDMSFCMKHGDVFSS